MTADDNTQKAVYCPDFPSLCRGVTRLFVVHLFALFITLINGRTVQGNDLGECSCFDEGIQADRGVSNDVRTNIQMMVVFVLIRVVVTMDIKGEWKFDSFVRKKDFFTYE